MMAVEAATSIVTAVSKRRTIPGRRSAGKGWLGGRGDRWGRLDRWSRDDRHGGRGDGIIGGRPTTHIVPQGLARKVPLRVATLVVVALITAE